MYTSSNQFFSTSRWKKEKGYLATEKIKEIGKS